MGDVVRLGSPSEIQPGEAKDYEVGKRPLAVFNIDGDYYAIDGFCTHAGGPLAEGFIDGEEVECPWHGASFNIKSGEALCKPAPCGVDTYPVHVEGDDLKVELPDT